MWDMSFSKIIIIIIIASSINISDLIVINIIINPILL